MKRVALAIAAVAVGLLTESASAQTTEDPAVNACKNTGLLALRDGHEDRHSWRGLHRPEGKDRKAGQVRLLARRQGQGPADVLHRPAARQRAHSIWREARKIGKGACPRSRHMVRAMWHVLDREHQFTSKSHNRRV